MKKSWFSLFNRSARHRGFVVGRVGDTTGCIRICPVCEKPLPEWELSHPKSSFFVNNVCVKKVDNKPDRISIWAEINPELGGLWKGSQDLSNLIVCNICYLDCILGCLKEQRQKAMRGRAIQAYDAELESEILTDAWGVTKSDFEDVARCRGDIENTD
jgi:hypothetical protein